MGKIWYPDGSGDPYIIASSSRIQPLHPIDFNQQSQHQRQQLICEIFNEPPITGRFAYRNLHAFQPFTNTNRFNQASSGVHQLPQRQLMRATRGTLKEWRLFEVYWTHSNGLVLAFAHRSSQAISIYASFFRPVHPIAFHVTISGIPVKIKYFEFNSLGIQCDRCCFTESWPQLIREISYPNLYYLPPQITELPK